MTKNKAKTLKDLVNKQKKYCTEEFEGNIIENKDDLVKLYLERDKLMERNNKECVDSTINKIFVSDYHTNIAAHAYMEDLIFEYRMGKQDQDQTKILEQITELEDMINNKEKFNNSKYGQMNKEKYNKILNNISIYYEDLSKFYNEMSFGELLSDGY